MLNFYGLYREVRNLFAAVEGIDMLALTCGNLYFAMKKHTKIFLLPLTVALFLLALTGCTSTETVVSDTLPYEAQQRINTSEEFDVDLTFEPHPDAEAVTASFGGAENTYRLNEPFRGKLEQLFRAKFGEISEDSDNKVKVEITDIDTESETGPLRHRLAMTVNVTTNQNDEQNEREFSFQTTIRPNNVGNEYEVAYRIPPESIEDFLMQYVVGIDSFLDSNFGIEG